ncbi:type I polyketide synthase [Nitrincola sp. MINF-07-Sa-05]|uniref:type I polyketide synthase n=1 Tax=Nitrincola salilacus TaxID=3400273 RepID=UPI003917CD73
MDKTVAIIGYSFRFPGTSQARFWQDLLDKRDLVTEVADDRWAKETLLHPDKRHAGTSYSFAAGSLGDISGFDAGFFGLSPRELTHMDPQQRMLLEMSWEAIESANMPPSQLRGSRCGVYIGIASGDYGYRYSDDFSAIDANTATGTSPSIAANRISFMFDLHGPSMAMDTACSSSMIAFHQACRAIQSGEISTALTGGISLHAHPIGFLMFSKATMLSPTGRCQVFDADGDGYVRSEGGGVFLLKCYEQALADGDPILAIVAGSAANADGSKSGLTIPNADAQVALMEQVYAKAGISADDITYLEAHGTGTPVGDPIETRAIGLALAQKRSKPLPIGSIKSNLGHLETASGVAGLAKALLSIRNRTIPATISMKTPNPNILFDDWNIRVVTDTQPLSESGVLTIGVNSFGFGGANAHVILQSPPETVTQNAPCQTCQPDRLAGAKLPIRITARSPEALKAQVLALSDFLANSEDELYNIAWSTMFRREHHPHGLLIFSDSKQSCREQLQEFVEKGEAGQVYRGDKVESAQGPIFVYSGNGCQWETMGRTLLEQSEIFRRAVVSVDQIFQQHAGFSLVKEIQGENGAGRFERTEIAQPALFALQVGITELLRSQGVQPVSVIGHSVGEVAAAWASGALSLEQAVKVIFYRSYHQGKTAGQGQMTAVALPVDEIMHWLEQSEYRQISLAGINSHRGVTLAGDADLLTALESELKLQGVRLKRLDLDYAFHSSKMDPIEHGVREDLSAIVPVSTLVPFISTVTGSVLHGENLGAEYWWDNIRQPVQFQSAVNQLLEQGNNTFIEIGGHPVLSSYLHEALREADQSGAVIPTVARQQDHISAINQSIAQFVLSGAVKDYSHWFPVSGQSVSLPGYVWQHESYWHPVTTEAIGTLSRHYVHPLLGYRTKQRQPTWQSELDTQRYPWLADHKVGGGVVFPGTGFTELALAAVVHLRAPEVIAMEDLEILSPLLLDDKNSKSMQIQMDSQTGSIHVYSCDKQRSDEWNLHLRARALSETVGSELNVTAPVLPVRQPDFTRSEHHAIASEIGLDYGPAFQAISHGWVDQRSVIGVFDITPEIAADVPALILHPGILDSAFQLLIQLLKEQLQQQSGIVFVPTQIASLQLRTACSGIAPTMTRVTLLKHSPHSLLAKVELFAADGQAMAVMDGVRLRAVALRKTHEQSISHLNYSLVPVSLPTQQAPQLPESSAWLHELSQLLSSQEAFETYIGEVEPLLDALSEAFVLKALSELAVDDGVLQELPVNLLSQVLLAQAHAEGWVSDEHPPRLLMQPETDPAVIWNLLVQDYPAHVSLTHMVGRAGLHLPALLRQHMTDDHPVPGRQQYAQALKNSLGEQLLSVLTCALAARMEKIQESLQPGQRLSVAEISAGLPLATDGICRKLDFSVSDYTCLSTSADTLAELSQHLHDYPLMQLGHIDTEALKIKCHTGSAIPLLDQVVIHLDFMALSQAQTVLRMLRPQLRPDAQIIMLVHQPTYWLDQVFGANDDWWIDASQSQQATPEQWQAMLKELGYQVVEAVPLSDNERGAVLISAVAPQSLPEEGEAADSVTPEHWCLFTDQADAQLHLTHCLTQALEAKGIRVSVCDTTDITAEDAHKLHDLIPSADVPPTRVVLISGLEDTNPVIDAQTRRCRLATALVGESERYQSQPQAIILTRGVVAMYDYQNAAPNADPEPVASDAAVWGFVRTLMNEYPQVPVRLVDLPAADDSRALSSLVEAINELHEDELFISNDGSCAAPRLRNQEETVCEDSIEQGKSSQTTLTLGFDLPGQLRNLHWYQKTLPLPAADEVQIDVKATGLNFRDVMYALGLLSDEAIENGFSGPTMGLEFAGVVTQVGAHITQFVKGDQVVGFGPASFTTRMCVSADNLTLIPKGIDFAGAATIPTTFFTVYYALKHLARLEPGERVLIHGAAGGVGLAAIQIARLLGAEIYATVGSQSKRDFLTLLGEDRVFDSRSLTFAEEILASTPDGQGVDIVLNSLAGEAINQNLRVLKPFGRFLELGKRDFYENTAIGLRPFRNNISYFGIDSDQLMKLRPELTQRLYGEMMGMFEAGDLHPLPYTQFHADHVIEAYRYMQQAKQIGKVVITYPQAPQAYHPESVKRDFDTQAFQISPDSTHLVTGGLNGFGLRTAQWLVEKGARHLVLISRSGPVTEEAQAAIAQFESQGVAVHACACDVTDRDALAALLSQLSGTMPPLKGVVHAATVFEDGLARHLSAEQIRQVLAVKISGAQNLHQLVGAELELFVLFSSATTLFGNPGQGNYVAANHWLEALAMSRHRQGLAATCVRWGAIDDVGYLARNQKIKEALEGRMGGRSLRSDQAMQQLEHLLLRQIPLMGVMELEWPAMARFLPNSDAAKFHEIAARADESDGGENAQAELLALLETQSPEEQIKTVTQILASELSKILLISEEKLDVNRSVYDMGFDSLMGVELMTAIENRFGVQLSVMALSEAPTLTRLAERLTSQLNGEEGQSSDEGGDMENVAVQLAQQHGVTDEIKDKLAEKQSVALEHKG